MATMAGKMDDLVKEYLVFRGLSTTMKSFDTELKLEKDKEFRADKIIDQLHSYVNSYDLISLRDYWNYLDSHIFSRLEQTYTSSIRKLEVSLYRWYLVNDVLTNRPDKVTEFFEKMAPEIQSQSEWKEWFALPFVKNPEENSTFSTYFRKQWQDTFFLSLHNFLSVIFQSMPLPGLLMFDEEKLKLRRLQDEIEYLRRQITNPDQRLRDFRGLHEKKNVLPITDHAFELMDDFFDISQEPPLEDCESQGVLKSIVKKITTTAKPSPTILRKTSPGSSSKPGPGGTTGQVKENQKSSPKDVNDYKIKGSHVAASVLVRGKVSSTAAPHTFHKKQPRQPEDHDKQRRELLGLMESKTTKPEGSDTSKRRSELIRKEATPVSRQMSEPVGMSQVPTSFESRKVKLPTEDLPESAETELPFLLLSQEEYNEHHSSILHCRFSESGKVIASLDVDGIVKIWSLDPSPATMATIMSKSPLMCFEWASKMDRFLLLGNKTSKLRLFDIKEKKNLIEVTADSAYPRISALAYSPSGTQFACAASGRGRGGNNGVETGPRLGRMSLWDLKTMKMDREIPMSPNPVAINCMAFNHNGHLLIAGGVDGMIGLFDVQKSECISTWGAHIGEVYSVQFSPDEMSCYSMGGDGKLIEWSIHKTGIKIADWAVHSGAAGPFVMQKPEGYKQMQTPRGKLFAFDAEGQHILTCAQTGGQMYALDRKLGAQKMMLLRGHKAPVVTCDWSTAIDCRTCLTGAMDGNVVVSTLLRH
ncbi:WD repeat-containing protein 91-like [Lineus longissimus]|uniref:WD repeat-containing protein 91-like n=1 Tax=Lineus longissimus TaxID=88925 RepID=UPI002B4EC8CC